MSEIDTIEASANVILAQCMDDGELLVRLERIAYAATVIAQQANEQIEKLKTARESNHG
ncbi:hypothetical protein [Burkholderia ubonensis]|uniref:hypothetical protein n=1 Tax=Burkholderia ubonensis TaxID=101571 RepID=UPI000A6BE9DD|nr:hypothetical protein [Burkholderia ubonensis]